MVSRWCRDGGMACIAGDFCFVCKAGMGVGIAASFRILGGCRDVAAGLEFECLPGSGQLAGMSYHLLALNLTALMLGTSAAFCLGVFTVFSIFVALGRLAYVSHQRLVRIASAFVGELGVSAIGYRVCLPISLSLFF